ncbi:hypothetical protein SMKI_09G1300 [Saccharomyces mikatae IFO 1815]|uniref:BZIP domain-containing protein n=1 Tax=Saccharomyces mikatae IFO 1815 TaxID=226126 RepID=A0AA35NGF3_SACMI|nr:uncharacterized protein SMKI_09G1300 [Saccharomyces mikatae IFO 1815]CAI4039722.1 hypothetical protein SMKI_09G1300 [Saccharomyces mikatae IFO 1815]
MFTGQEYHSVDSNSTQQKDNNKRGLDDTSKILNDKIPHTTNNTAAGAMNNSGAGRPLDPNGVNYSPSVGAVVDPMHDYATSNRNSLTPQYTNVAAGNASSPNQVVNHSANSNYQQATYLRQQQHHQQQQQQQQQSPSMKTEEESQLYGDFLMNSGVVPDVHQNLTTHTNLDQLTSARRSVPSDAAAAPANATNIANTTALNKQAYFMNMNMNNNPHALNDPSILESLSPFFQPFGVDVAHLPMTNPPIFQSSLPGCDEPIRRRRISISNGQISQLGEDIETLENLHNTQPPPMPNFHNYHSIHQNKNSLNKPVFSQAAPVSIPQYNAKKDVNHIKGASLGDQDTTYSKNQQHGFSNAQLKNVPAKSASDLEGMTTFAPTTNGENMSKSALGESLSNHSSTLRSQGSHSNLRSNLQGDPTPGTTAWKRARLLERNRIAASKCRQRKKVAQLQLQKEFNEIKDENRILQKKLNYYEKLISKFKKFSKIHLREHEKLNKNSENTEDSAGKSKNESMTVDSLKIIEELLMIDSDVTEVDKETGKIITIKHEPYTQRFGNDTDDDGDDDDDGDGMELKFVEGGKNSND